MLYQEIFNQAHGFEGLLDLDGTLQYVNDAALDFGGVTRDDVVGKKFWDTDWIRWSKRVQQQVRADVERAAAGEFVRHELEVQGEERRAIIDFSIHPFTNKSGTKTWLLPEGRDITQLKYSDGVSPRVPLELKLENRLVTYSRDSDEAMSNAIIEAFLALDIDIFERETNLADWINTDALDKLEWCSERPLTVVTRIWGYNVILAGDEVRIYADS